MGTSFYGNVGGAESSSTSVSLETIDEEIFKNVVVSKTQPTNQAVGGIWFVVEGDDTNNG